MISLHASTLLGHHQGFTWLEYQKLQVKICIKYSKVYAYVVRASVKTCVCVVELKSHVLFLAVRGGWSGVSLQTHTIHHTS
jgi:hypothetical protein